MESNGMILLVTTQSHLFVRILTSFWNLSELHIQRWASQNPLTNSVLTAFCNVRIIIYWNLNVSIKFRFDDLLHEKSFSFGFVQQVKAWTILMAKKTLRDSYQVSLIPKFLGSWYDHFIGLGQLITFAETPISKINCFWVKTKWWRIDQSFIELDHNNGSRLNDKSMAWNQLFN